MTPYEILSIMLEFLAIITSLFIALVMLAHEKSNHEK